MKPASALADTNRKGGMAEEHGVFEKKG